MADPKLVPGTLYINRDRDYRTGDRGPYVKIGIVRNDREAEERNREHQTGNPREVITLYALKSPMVEHLEKQLHHRFAKLWLTGEWFEMTDSFVSDTLVPEAETLIAQQDDAIEDFELKLELKDHASTGVTRPPEDEEKAIWERAVSAREWLKLAQVCKELYDANLRAAIGNSSGIDGILRLVRKENTGSFDQNRFVAEHPDLATQYVVSVPPKVKGTLSLKGSRSLANLDAAMHAAVQAAKGEIQDFSVAQTHSPEIPRSTSILTAHAEFVSSLADVARAEWDADRHLARLARQLGEDEAIEGIVSWSRTETSKESHNWQQFKKDYPDLHAQYLKPDSTSISVNINFYRPYPLPG